MRVVLCHGAFDCLHWGHVEHLREARGMGDMLVVSVSPDGVVGGRKPGRPVLGVEKRLVMLRALRVVDQVWVCPTVDGVGAILHWCPAYYVKGIDYEGVGVSKGERQACKLVGARVAITRTEKFSTTEYLKKMRKAA